MYAVAATGKSVEGLAQARFTGKECKEGDVQLVSKQEVHGLKDGEQFLMDFIGQEISITLL